jgi:outer membrane lipoprotein-sorting protein
MSRLPLRYFAAALLLLTFPAVAAQAVPDIHQYTSDKIKTLRLDSEIVYENHDQLENIGGDFADFYQVQRGARSLSLIYQQPGMLRYDANVIGAHITYVLDGDTRTTVIPFLHIHKTEDIAGAPGKKNTLLDCGVVPPEFLNQDNATYLRTQNGLLCFQLLGKLKSEPFKDLVWIDPKTHITEQRYHYDRNGKLTAWYLYKNPVLIAPGIYFPTRVEVYSPENKLAGVTVYRNIRVNTPVDPATFHL